MPFIRPVLCPINIKIYTASEPGAHFINMNFTYHKLQSKIPNRGHPSPTLVTHHPTIKSILRRSELEPNNDHGEEKRTQSTFEDFHVSPELPTIARHRFGRGCWAYTATAMKSWKDNKTYTIEEVVKDIDKEVEQMEYEKVKAATPPGEKAQKPIIKKYWDRFLMGRGITLEEMQEYLEALGLQKTSLEDGTADDIRSLLEEHGPLWVVEDRDKDPNNEILHAIVITGIEGDGTTEGTYLHTIDPASRKAELKESLEEFMEKYGAATKAFEQEGISAPLQVAHY